MRIFVSADMEGVNGIVHPEQITAGCRDYETSRVWMTEEVNALACGLFEGGAREVFVTDAHDECRNILFDRLDERVQLMQGDTRRNSMVQGLDESFDGLVLLGYHAKFGTPKGVLDHTYNPETIEDVRINGVSCGELALNAMYGAEKGVPLILVTGDQNVEREAKDFCPGCEAAVVKYAEGRFCARFLPRARGLELIRSKARLAVENLGAGRVMEVKIPIEMEIVFRTANLAEGAMRVSGVERTGNMSVKTVCDSAEEMLVLRQVIFNAASGFQSANF